MSKLPNKKEFICESLTNFGNIRRVVLKSVNETKGNQISVDFVLDGPSTEYIIGKTYFITVEEVTK